MLQDSVIVKTNYYGDFRRFTVDKEIEYSSFVTVLQDLYDDKTLSPPSTHTIKYVDEEGDSITVVTSNDLKLAISYSRTLSCPILRLIIERKMAQSTASQVPSLQNIGTDNLAPNTSVPFPTLKIQGRPVQPPTEIKERYGPKKIPPPCMLEKNNIESDLLKSNINQNGTKSDIQEIQNQPLFSCQSLSEETRKKFAENSLIISSSQKQLGEKTAKEIDDFANDISKTFKNFAQNSNLNAERSINNEKDALAESSFKPLSSSNLTFPENGFDVTESTLAKFKALSLSTIEQAKEIDAIKEHHLIESGIMMKKAKDLHDSTVNLVKREGSKLI